MKDKRKAGGKGFVIAGFIIIIGIMLSIGFFIYTLTGMNDNSYKFIAPSEKQMFLEKGNYTIFYEYRSEFEGELYSTNDKELQGLRLIIIDKDTNKLIEVRLPNGSSTYSINGNSGYAIYTFEIDKDSELSIESVSDHNKNIILKITDGIAKTIIFSVFILFFGVSISVIVGVILIILTASKNNKQRKEELEKAIKAKKSEKTKQVEKAKQVEKTKGVEVDIKDESVVKMWSDYLQENNMEEASIYYEAWAFGSDESMASELADLVVKGKKQGTTSLYKLLEIDKEKLPKVGEYSIVTNWDGKAMCIIETTDVRIKPFSEVDETFARIEGEGDGSLYFWKKVHIDFFTKELKTYDLEFSEDLLVVCETFKVVYK